MSHLRLLLLPLLVVTAAVAGDPPPPAPPPNPLTVAMTGNAQFWDMRDLVYVISDAREVAGVTSYMWRVRDALLPAKSELDLKYEASGIGDIRGLLDLVEWSVAPREPAVVVLCVGNAFAIGKIEAAATPDQFGKALADALARLQTTRAEIVVLGPSPISDTPEVKNPANDLSAKYAEIAASTSRAADASYIDMRAACLDLLKANPPSATKVVLTAGEARYTAAWHELAATLVAKAIGERMANAPIAIGISDTPFLDSVTVDLPLKRLRKGAEVELRYSLDGKDPAKTGRKFDKPFQISSTSTLTVTATDKTNNLVSTAKAVYTKVKGKSAESISRRALGLEWGLFLGKWQTLPDFASLKVETTGIWNAPEVAAFRQSPVHRAARDSLGLSFYGYIDIPAAGAYRFSTFSSDGSRMWVDDELAVDNDGRHGNRERGSKIALSEGTHRVRIDWFTNTSFPILEVWWQSDGVRRSRVPDSAWCHNLGKPHDWKVPEKPTERK